MHAAFSEVEGGVGCPVDDIWRLQSEAAPRIDAPTSSHEANVSRSWENFPRYLICPALPMPCSGSLLELHRDSRAMNNGERCCWTASAFSCASPCVMGATARCVMFRHLLGFSIGGFQAAPARPTLPDIIRDPGTRASG